MRFRLGNNGPRGSVGLDVDGGFVAAVQAEHGCVQRAESVDLDPGLITDGEVTDRVALSERLRDFFRERDLPSTVRLGVANHQIVVRQIELPMIESEADMDAAIRFQAAEAIAMPLEEAVLEYQITGQAQGTDGARRAQVVVVAARRDMVRELTIAARDAGLKPEGIDLDAFALVRTLSRDSVSDSSARVHCHLAGVTNLAVALGSNCLFTRPLRAPWAGDDMSAVAAGLAEEIRLSIDYFLAQPGARPVGDVVLSGPGAQQQELVDELQVAVGLPVAVPEPLGVLDASALGPEQDRFRYTVAAGLAVGAPA